MCNSFIYCVILLEPQEMMAGKHRKSLLFPLLFLLLCRVWPRNRKTENCYSKTAAFASHSYYSRCWNHSSFQRLWSTKCIFWGSFGFITGKNKANLPVKCFFLSNLGQSWLKREKALFLFSPQVFFSSLYQLGVLEVIWFKMRFNSVFIFCLLSIVFL